MRRLGPLPPSFLLLLGLVGLADACGAAAYARWARAAFAERASARGEVAVVFFADFGAASGLGPESRRRVGHAARLYDARRVERILCVGGARPASGRFGAELMARALVAGGVPPQKVLVGSGSHDTHGNLRSARARAEEQGWRELVAVSAPLHLHRIRRIAESRAPDELAWSYSGWGARARPPASAFELWGQVHHEWAAALLEAALPRPLYARLLAWLRRA